MVLASTSELCAGMGLRKDYHATAVDYHRITIEMHRVKEKPSRQVGNGGE